MDAPTTATADNGSSGGSSGDWGWFTPAKPSKESPDEQQERPDRAHGGPDVQEDGGIPDDVAHDRGPEPDHGGYGPAGGHGHAPDLDWFAERHDTAFDGPGPRVPEQPPAVRQERIPERRPAPVRPVGTAAARGVAPGPGAAAGPPAPAPFSAFGNRPFQAASAPDASPAPTAPASPAPAAPPPAATRPAPTGPLAPAGAAPAPTGFPPPADSAPTPAATAPTPAAPSAAAPDPAIPTAAAPIDQLPAAPAQESAAAPIPEATTPATAAPQSSPAALESLVSAVSPGAPESADAALIRRTLTEIELVSDKVTSYFYAMLFVQHPDLRALFPAAMDTQRDRLFKALLTAARHIDDSDRLTAYLSHLGRGHRKYGTLPDHYPAVGESLLGALARYATLSWGPETEAAWVRAYTVISQIMIDAAAENEAVAPAWWQAEVVSHERRTPDIAVVTVRPDQPYPFRAGQYTSLETPWWPRVWRHYSFASAPRSDGLLSFHIKAVPAGWVSNALVHRARPGDVLRLGGPVGSMTVDHTTRNGLLCVGGGTGIAPIKALIEDVATHGVRRRVEVFYGARSDHDLYDMDTMLRLESSYPWLQVRPVVSTGPAAGRANGVTGELPDAVRQYGPWREFDAYLSGPPGLIRSGLAALVGAGVPTGRIRHDSVDELVPAGE
ncbi:globin domain-containing protein [Streptomyces sp. NPDC059080]|uniref:globin domain-containing protein n=1 Tax=Streptomyces sp. NPDC059080 TaxID=3346718 RepID=UPI0036BC5FA1